MSQATVNLQPIQVSLTDLYLDPNNPRFTKSLNLDLLVPDDSVAASQDSVRRLFVIDGAGQNADDAIVDESEEDTFDIADLVKSMQEIGFIPIDQVVVRRLSNDPTKYLVIEGNRRICSAKYLSSMQLPTNPEKLAKHRDALSTLEKIDVLLLVTDGLPDDQIHEQIGVVLGLRHFGAVLPWGTLAKAVNIYNEYKHIPPLQEDFAFDAARLTKLAARLSQSRSELTNALKTYIVYLQLQDAFPTSAPRPTHYSLLQACVLNRKLQGAKFITQNQQNFQVDQASLERLHHYCEFGVRDSLLDDKKTLRDPKAVSKLAALVHEATAHADAPVRAFASSLLNEVHHKDRTLEDAANHLKSFMSDRVWTDALGNLLDKVLAPPSSCMPSPDDGAKRLNVVEFKQIGNELMMLEEAEKAFKNLRRILAL